MYLSVNERQDKLIELLATSRPLKDWELAQLSKVPRDTLMSDLDFLSQNGFIKQEKESEGKTYVFSSELQEYLQKGTPEENLLQKLPISVLGLNPREKIGLQWLLKEKIVKLDFGNITRISQTKPYVVSILEKIKEGQQLTQDEEIYLKSRNLLKDVKTSPTYLISFVKRPGDKKKITQITPQLIKSRAQDTELQEYDVTEKTIQVYPGKKHPLQVIADEMKQVLLGMGFKEMDGPIVESGFWNFDVLFMPQNHPSREIMDTFFINPELKADLPEFFDKVRDEHLKHYSSWSEEESRKLVLRTHTTPSSFRHLKLISEGKLKSPQRLFSINKVFRNEAIDKTHLPEFNQVEGFIIGEDLSLSKLMGTLKTFYEQMGVKKIKFKPVYNPYTEPSMEVFGWHEGLNKWIEIGNSGLFRRETLEPLGINQRVIAWGLAVERAVMIKYNIQDIRQIVGPHTSMNFLREFNEYVDLVN
ncbi:Phenylalanine--tRNA ligase alpha subunit [uncultured archaeon]|nr:Phenylalanine--tRNA ligase alpha subunit [uncultured archaeon]